LKVVKATNSIDDIESLKEVALEWKEECKGDDFGIELIPGTFFSHLADMINDVDKELFLLLRKDKVIGFMGAIIFQSPLGNQNICQEHFWYIAGKHRGRGTLLLFRAMKEWAKERGCSHLIMNASCLASGIHDKLCRFYEKTGFKKFETSFIKEIL
jgi:GNAT superfamily N-acetyltransferase